METKLSRLFLALSFVCVFAFSTKAQQEYISDVYIDKVKMESSDEDYRALFYGKTVSDSLQWNEMEEVDVQVVDFKGDSLHIHMSSNYDRTHLYTDFIEVYSPKYLITYHDMGFRVGMNIDSLALRFPELKREYEEYIGEKKKFFSRPAYLGKELLIKMGRPDLPFYPCQGLKFQLKEGIVISILVDFRTEGDFY